MKRSKQHPLVKEIVDRCRRKEEGHKKTNATPNRLAIVWRVRRKIVDSLRTASPERHAHLQAALRGVDFVLVAASRRKL
jgi:hypothetical protein